MIYTVNELVGPEPIAYSFSCATVMFADIYGFTSWSSNRNPVDVFQLLELLFKEFDIVGFQTGVFKVSRLETATWRLQDFLTFDMTMQK